MGKIFKEARKLLKNKYVFFTTPGHKQGRGFERFKNILRYDLTEVQGLDNLHNPSSCIKYSLEELSEFYGSEKSYYLLNGSTSGIQIMIFSLFNEGDEILIERGCHKSVINSILLRKLKVNYISREKYNIDFLMPDKFSKINYNDKDIILNDLKKEINKNPNIKGVLLTNPNYYGFYFKQDKIYEYLKLKKIFLIIDGAHGAHLRGFNKGLECVNKFCDMSVMSAHKTLSTFTQGAYLHVNNQRFLENVDEYFSIFTTTSPSYLTMISLEKGLEDSKKYFKKKDILVETCNNFTNSIKDIKYLESIRNDYINWRSNGNFYYDDTRICLRFEVGNLNSNNFYNYLFSNKIICEMVFFNGVVLIPTIYTKSREFKYLINLIKDFKFDNNEDNYIFDVILESCNASYEKVLEPFEVQNKNYKFVEIEYCVGEILLNDIFLYPPGVPIIIRGERVLIEHINLIKEYKKFSYNINGLYLNKYLKVLEE